MDTICSLSLVASRTAPPRRRVRSIRVQPPSPLPLESSRFSPTSGTPLYPPLDPRCAAYVDDASPSIVAARIAECLRRRSVAAEFDDEAATCSGLAYDGGGAGGVRFHVRLYRGGRGRTPPNPPHASSSSAKDDCQGEAKQDSQQRQTALRPDFSAGVIVEVQKARGDALAFHPLKRSVLTCASAIPTESTTFDAAGAPHGDGAPSEPEGGGVRGGGGSLRVVHLGRRRRGERRRGLSPPWRPAPLASVVGPRHGHQRPPPLSRSAP